MNSQKLTKFSLRAFIVSIVASAVVGIWVIAVPNDDWDFELKVFLTTVIIAGASICGLTCGGCLSRGHRVLPGAGLMLTLISAGLLLVGMWAEIHADNYWKATISISCFAVACSHLSLLFMANLAGSYRWAFMVAHQLILGLATLIAAGIILDFFDNDSYWRLVGVVSILVAAVTLLIPVFHYFSREQIKEMQESIDPLAAVDREMAQLKRRLEVLEGKRQMLLATAGNTPTSDASEQTD